MQTAHPDAHTALQETAHLYARVKDVIPETEWPLLASPVAAINRLKRERNAVVLAHNYQTPDIFHCVADIVGDSLALARRAAETDADVIVMAGVHFMAETVKLLNPEKIVLIPEERAGCSLAASITGADVRGLRAAHPGVPIVTYVNTSADVKAESDICCTSGNAVEVVESLGVDRVILIPDEYLAKHVAKNTDVEIINWRGRCEVHELYTGEVVERFRRTMDDLIIIAHPECPPDVIDAADFAGSTAQMVDYVKDRKPSKVMLLTECSMSDNVAAEVPEVELIRACSLCPHMKRITLDNILESLETLRPRVEIPEAVAERARRSVERMLTVK